MPEPQKLERATEEEVSLGQVRQSLEMWKLKQFAVILYIHSSNTHVGHPVLLSAKVVHAFFTIIMLNWESIYKASIE